MVSANYPERRADNLGKMLWVACLYQSFGGR